MNQNDESDAERLLSEKTRQLFKAIDCCLAEEAWEPTLILIFAGIDAMAWLDRPHGQDDVQSQDFIKWCDSYLLDDAAKKHITPEDLYGARCGLVHSHTAESSKNRQRSAKKVFYNRQMGTQELMIIQLHMTEELTPVWVDLDFFVALFKYAVDKFRQQLAADPVRRERAYQRIVDSYMTEVLRVRV